MKKNHAWPLSRKYGKNGWPTTFFSVFPLAGICVCFWWNMMNRCAVISARMMPGIRNTCRMYIRGMTAVPGNSPPNRKNEMYVPTIGMPWSDALGDPQARAGQLVVGERVAEQALEHAQREQHDADQPVDLARLAVRAGEEHPEHVRHDRDHEHDRGPVVDLPASAGRRGCRTRCSAWTAYACDIVMPSSLVYEPWYTTGAADGSKNSARYVPVSSRITKDQSAISPSMNDQWSGKTFFIRTRTPLAPWNRSSSHPPTPSRRRPGSLYGHLAGRITTVRSLSSSALPEARADRLREVAGGRDVPSESIMSGSCGSARAAGPKITLAPFAASKVDWWHGQRMWWVVCSYSATGQPTWVQILE